MPGVVSFSILTEMLRAGRQPRVRSYSVRHVLRHGLLHHPVHVLRDGVGGAGGHRRGQCKYGGREDAASLEGFSAFLPRAL